MRNAQKLRKLYKKTQDEMADVIGYSKPLYVAFERGKMDLPEQQIEILCAYFHVTKEYLLSEEE